MLGHAPGAKANMTPAKKQTTFERVFAHGDLLYRILLVASAVALIALIAGVGIMLWQASGAARASAGAGFITGERWNPSGGVFGALPFIAGTLLTSLIAVLIAVPFGLAIAIFLAELCPPALRRPIGTMIELLAAVPSVVYGLWGIFVFIPNFVKPIGNFLMNTFGAALPVFGGPFFGPSIFAAGVILAVMIIPTITSISRDVFLAIPSAQREASFGLGATQSETILRVLVPYGLSGILGAVILGLGRALGETMAVTMTIGNVSQMPSSILNAGYTMSSVIANEWGEASSPVYSSALLEIGLLLFVVSLLLNLFARALVWSVSRRNPEQRS